MSDELASDEDVEPGRISKTPFVVLGVALAALAGVIVWTVSGNSISSPAHLPEGVALVSAPELAVSTTTATGAPIDSVSCVTESKEVTKLHTHTLVLVYDHGAQRRIPAGVGITSPWITEHISGGDFFDVGPSDCLYWIHTHAADGIVHVESPLRASFTLGQFFDIWRQPLSAQQVGPAHGQVTAFVNGKVYMGTPRGIPLKDGATIQLDVGTPVVKGVQVHFHVIGGCGQGSLTCSSSQK